LPASRVQVIFTPTWGQRRGQNGDPRSRQQCDGTLRWERGRADGPPLFDGASGSHRWWVPRAPCGTQAGFSCASRAPGAGSPCCSQGARPVGAGPWRCDRAAVPGRQCPWRDEPVAPLRCCELLW